MIFINPWTYYQIHEPDKIPDLNPHNDKEMVGCFAGVCGFIIASIIFALVTYLLFSITVSEYIKPLLMLVNCIVIYPILTILLMKLSFKIGDKFIAKKKK
jgi:uncharacterized protein YacL